MVGVRIIGRYVDILTEIKVRNLEMVRLDRMTKIDMEIIYCYPEAKE